MSWPGGPDTQLRLDGRARDAVTIDPAGRPVVVDEATLSVGMSQDRTIEDLVAEPQRDGLRHLVGCRGGSHLRGAIDQALPGLRESGALLHLLLDDLSGSSLISRFVWSRWNPDFQDQLRTAYRLQTVPSMEGVCIGFRPGSAALVEQGSGRMGHRAKPVGSLVNPDDPDGWHALAGQPEVAMRRARFIDVWREGPLIQIRAGFQDSATDPNHGRIAVHEYRLTATADRGTGRLRSIDPEAHVLPFIECPDAIASARSVVGQPLDQLRTVVLNRLAKTKGCTHLNDAIRALAEIPVLLSHLPTTTTS